MGVTSKIGVTEGSGKNVSTYSIAEDSVTKEVQRLALNDSLGNDIAIEAKLGIVTEVAPTTDTASSGINGRLQRIAQRATTLITNLGTLVFGTGTMTNALKVTVATDDAIPAVLGTTSGAAVITDIAGTAQQYLRGLVKMIAAGITVTSASPSVPGKTWTLTRTNNTTAYAANQVIGNGAGAGGAVIDFGVLGLNAADVLIQSLTLEIDDTALKTGGAGNEGAYAYAIYNASPPSNLGDGGNWTLPAGDRSAYLTMITVGTPNVPLAGALTLRAELDNIGKQVTLAGTHLFGYLITLNAYTPSALRVYSGSIHTIVP